MCLPQGNRSGWRKAYLPALFVSLLCSGEGIAIAGVIAVSSAADSGPGTLREAIALAAPGDEIRFDSSLAGVPLLLTTGELLIDKELIITGLGESQTILNGNANSRILNVTSNSHVAISNLTIRNGLEMHLLESGVVGEGGGVYNAGTLALTHASILSNTSGARGVKALAVKGGGVFNSGTITFEHCTLQQNQTRGEFQTQGGAIYNAGSAILNNTKVSDNVNEVARIHGVVGAAIYNESSATLSLVDSEVARNIGVTGGIFNQGMMILTRTTVANNSGTTNAAVVNAGDATLTDSIITRNSACPLAEVAGIANVGVLRADHVLVSENTGCVSSGGISNSGEMRLFNSTVTDNRGFLGGAGGIINGGTADIVSCTITGNRSNYLGGIAMPFGNLRMKNTILAGNFCPIKGLPGQECGGVDLNCSGTGTSLGNNLLSETSACVWLGGAHSSDTVTADWKTVLEGAEKVGYGLAPFVADNGGPTPTIALLPSSPAIDHTPLANCTDTEGNPITTDQRGVPRPQGTGCDIGAFEFSLPRGAGFWAHQCSDKGFHQIGDAELQALFTKIADASSVFPECAPISCYFLQPQNPKNDMKARAQQGLLDVWLNVTSGRLTRGRPIDLAELTTAITVGEALGQLELTVCDPLATHTNLANAKDIAEALNGSTDDLELGVEESAIALLPGARRTITLGLINMSASNRNYSVTASGPWPVQLSTARINALGSGQLAQITATITAPLNTQATTAQIQFIATDLQTQGLLKRDVIITAKLASSPTFQPVQKPKQVN